MNILISPLNWGIGHATRLVPIINTLKLKHNITIAADGKSFDFLKNEFPSLVILSAPKLNITYTKNATLLPLKILLSFPKFILFFYQNKKFAKKTCTNQKIDLIISDNRFGFFSKKIKSVFITHQLNIKAKNKIAEAIILKINKLNIEKFHECWIPDINENINLSGELSYSKNYKMACKKTGILSRFPVSEKSSIKIKYDIVVIISGPEPQRSIFEEIIISELKETKQKILIITGKINFETIKISNNITITNHLKTPDFQSIIKNTEIIISRAGYSSIMDFVSLKQTAILIPTPGQTEQEYLANYLHKNKLFYAVEQKKFNKNTIFTFNKYKPILKNNISEINNKTNLNTFFDEQFNL